MAISTQYTKLIITGSYEKDDTSTDVNIEVPIKSFPDLGAAPTAIDVTTLADSEQKFIPGMTTRAAMEFVANYETECFNKLKDAEGNPLTYTITLGNTDSFVFKGTHSINVAGAGLNAAVDMKLTVLPNYSILDSKNTAEE